jgi:hypothetical protein
VSCPDLITLDDNSLLHSINPDGQAAWLRKVNNPTSQANPLYHEWGFMYALNGAMNNVLENVDLVSMSNEKKATIKAWAYFWKGFAYSRIGSMYYAGIINHDANRTNNLYVTKEQVMAEAELQLSKCELELNQLTGNQDYTQMLNYLIPSVNKPGKGGTLSTAEWVRNINTIRARNILVNAPVASLTSAQWDQILVLTNNGIRMSDNTFTCFRWRWN